MSADERRPRHARKADATGLAETGGAQSVARTLRPSKGPDVLAKVSVPTLDLTLGERNESKFS